MQAMIDNCALMGMSNLIGFEPFGNAPVNITMIKSAPANAPLANIGQTYIPKFSGNTICCHVQITTAIEIHTERA